MGGEAIATPEVLYSMANPRTLPARNGGMARHGTTKEIAESMKKTDIGGSFLGSIVAGLLIGLLLDWWLGTEPWFVIGLALLGSYSGFMRVWHYAKVQGELEDEERRARGR